MLVETLQGKLEGVQEDSLQAFRGVPFARPPTGVLRFHAPEPSEPWVGVREASRFGRAAPQTKAGFDLFSGFDVGEQGEDCLYLNVYTPAADGARRPVMLWIHGGAYIMGSGSQAVYRFGALVRRGDVVVVSIN
ncbi:MAG: carboxylesterase family protein, partial [Deltaproteobacteria bacterium]|nr:carboxylesterase family protein [Deltaproteobacteria bacterium]